MQRVLHIKTNLPYGFYRLFKHGIEHVLIRHDLYKAVARALIGGLNIHIFMLCPINFVSNQVDFKRN